MSEGLTLRARFVAPMAGPVIENGAVRIEGGIVRAVGRWGELSGGGEVEDLGDAWLLPGFVNAHTHLELSCYAGKLAPQPFWSWIEGLIELRRQPGAGAREKAAIVDGATQSLLAGVTCVGDISRSGGQIAALAGISIRRVCFVELISGASPPGDPEELIETLDEAESAVEELTTLGVSPHALYSVAWNDLRRVVAIAGERDMPITMHAAETPEEIGWLRDGGGAVSDFLARYRLPNAAAPIRGGVMELLHRAQMTRLRPLLAHGNYIDDAELGMLAETRCSVAYCPRTHQYFGHPEHRWREMLRRGINVVAATDSLASNPSLSVLEELRLLRRESPDVPADVLIGMGTARAAGALGIDRVCGTIAPGLSADFVMLEARQDRQSGELAVLLDSPTTIEGVWVTGSRVVCGGRIVAKD